MRFLVLIVDDVNGGYYYDYFFYCGDFEWYCIWN